MGIEKQKLTLKVIPFTDHAIEKCRDAEVKFIRSPHTNGLRVIRNPNTNNRYFQLTYFINKKRKKLSLGLFVPDVRGTAVIAEEMLNLIKLHKNKNKTKWLSDPRVTVEDQSRHEVKTSNEETVNQCIEALVMAGYPKAKIKDEFLSATSQRTHNNFLIGNSIRTEQLSYGDDKDGNGRMFFKPGGPQSFPELFRKYPSGVGVKKSRTGETSVYDSPLGLRPIRELTHTVIDQYLTAKDRSQGQQENILLAFQCLWTFACKLKVFGEDIPNNPTSRRDNRIIIMKSRKSRAPGRAYNDRIFSVDDLPKLDRAFVKLSPKFPFQAEALNFMCVTGRRMEETLKISKDAETVDEDGNPIIFMPGSITKSRRDAKIDITDPVRRILDRLKVLREGEYKRFQFVKWMFPTLRVNRQKLIDNPGDYINSNHTRIKNLQNCWWAIEKETGLKGSPKMFRKTFTTHGGDIVGDDDMIGLTDHKDKKTLQEYYKKFLNSKRKRLAGEVAKLYTFPRAVND